jgi:hypothetical protein
MAFLTRCLSMQKIVSSFFPFVMKKIQPAKAPRRNGLFFPILLAVILAVLFAKSFLPGYVHFSNDGPLGQQNAAWRQLPAGFTGSWYDLNDIGTDVGAIPPAPSSLIFLLLGPVGYAKFLAPIALFILGLGAWTLFRQLKFSPLAAVLGGLAAALNSAFFATACWGVALQQIAMGMVFFALALVMANSPETPRFIRWSRLALAGLCVGVSVMEGADNGAIFSLFVAAYVFFKSLNDEGVPVMKKIGRGIGRVAMIALFAGFIATETVTSLVGTYIVGTAGMQQNKKAEDSQAHWDWATQWSLPKIETLGLFVPGVFGYKMDTPVGMDFLEDDYKGGQYWGGIGRDPVLDRYFESGSHGPMPQYSFMRQTGGQNYAGILVALVAFLAIAQSFRKQNSIFPKVQRRFIWFWTAALVISLLLAWGRFAPFYKFLYMLPYFSTIRNPIKFLAVFSLAIVILFAYGMDALSRRYLQTPNGKFNSVSAQFKNWRATVRSFDRNWSLFCVIAFGVSVFAWLVYASQKSSLVHYLQRVGFGDEDMAKEIAGFSIGQVGWSVLTFALAVALVILVLAGIFSGKRARFGGFLLGALLVADLGRADLPYIIHWNYIQKYASNPIIDFLRDKPYEHRVADLHSKSLFEDLYRIEWSQQLFPYYNIQSLDIIQSPRVTADLEAYDLALTPTGENTYYLVARRWQLTNTRYLLGPAGFLDQLNEQLDPAQHRFRIVQRFNVVPKPGIEQPTELEQLTAVPDDNGEYALFDFAGALPRAKLYTDWQTNSAGDFKNFTTNGLSEIDTKIFDDAGTNGFLTLKKLTSPSFNPEQTVLLDAPLPEANPSPAANQDSGKVEFKSYSPKKIVFSARAVAPSVLLLNGKFDPHWRVTVDGKPAELFRADYIMRGVFVPPGAHTVEFQFSLPSKPLYVTLAAIAVSILLCGVLLFRNRVRLNPSR